MQVEILEEGGVKHGQNHYQKGDRVTSVEGTDFDGDVAEAWCAHGWAKDVAGKVETGERRTDGQVTLKVDGGSIDNHAEAAG